MIRLLAQTLVSVVRRPWQAFLFGAVALSCSDSANVTATRSLRGASDVSVLCVRFDEDGSVVGRPLDSCPDLVHKDLDGEDRGMLALVTQKETGEIAVVNMSGCADAAGCGNQVIDLEVTQPGTNFLPVGAEPVSVVSTTDGVASFVAVAEPGQEGIFALPTSCIGPRPRDALFRDIRTFPACRLPATPSVMEVLVDSTRGTLCDGSALMRTPNSECPADLDASQGRSKLAVALPSLGQIVILDAQQLLDAPPGTFDACPIEHTVSLEVALPAEPIPQVLPEDLAGTPAQCLPQGFEQPIEQSFDPNPSDFALRDGTLYVSDYEAPVIHVLDVGDPCNVAERPPLLPRSFMDPAAVITTRRVAASPLTPAGNRYVYAVDDSPQGAGSVMVFDVSEESGQRTPIVRPRSRVIDREPPDRIQFDQEVSDVEFAVHDFPEPDPRTGVAVEGLSCEPAPERSGSIGALYRPDPEEGEGAGPRKLRGAFAFVVLHSGFVVTVDIEDLDAPCRRPARVNPTDVVDARGCLNDPYSSDLVGEDDLATVSDEFSCNISEPHRPRAGSYYFAEAGGTAPALRSFPQLRDRTGTSLAADQSESGKGHPRMLGVNRLPWDGMEGDASVIVGTAVYKNERDDINRLIVDPAESERNSVVLPYAEPRAYGANLNVTVTYEGAVRSLGDGLVELANRDELGLPDDEVSRMPRRRYAVLSRGPNANFCQSGLEDDHLIRDRAGTLMSSPSAAELDQFARQYADYVDISSDLLPEEDPYWNTSAGRTCGASVSEAADGVTGRFLCELVFGNPTLPNTTREFRIQRAFNDQLIMEPRRFDSESERQNILELAECCFPQNIEFRVRASQHWVVRSGGAIANDVSSDPDTRACIRDCNPLVQGKNARVFELSCEGSDDCRVDENTSRAIGPRQFELDERSLGPAMGCILDAHPVGGVQPGAPGSECIYESPTSRFAIYRGLLPSERDMTFSYRVLGGFAPLSVDLLGLNRGRTSTSPEKLTYVPNVNRLLIADGGSTGLVFLGLRRTDGGPGFTGTVVF
jgi:hypothetical protein